MHHSKTTAANTEPLPPDVAAARRTRINSELIALFKRPCPPNTVPSAQGIGLYSHVAGPPARFPHERYRKLDPEFLPVGGPKRMKREGGLEASISDEVKNVWAEVKAVVDEEEKHVGQAGMDIDRLRVRYGALDVPDRKTQEAPPQAQQQPQPQLLHILGQLQDYVAAGRGSNRDVVMGETDPERRGSINTNTTGSTYQRNRDPRLLGR